MPVKKRCEVQIWRASPEDVEQAEWRALTKLLDLSERSKAFDFRVDADRKAYVLVHGLRRLVLSKMLGVRPESLVFRDNDKGQPLLIQAHHRHIYFSHSHTRAGVLFAASADVAVGVDAESVAVGPADFTLLRPFLDLPGSGAPASASFYIYWTALEAFWKAAGTGLSTNHPRLRLTSLPHGHWRVAFEAPGASDMTTLATQAVILPLTAAPGCTASLAILWPFGRDHIAVEVHENEFMKNRERSRLFFMPKSAATDASGAPHPSFSQS